MYPDIASVNELSGQPDCQPAVQIERETASSAVQ
jgi:hypothetical protein